MSEWKATLDALRSQIGEREFKTWFEPINLLSFNFSAVDLEVPNRFYLSWISEKYHDLVKKTLFQVTRRNIEVRFHVADTTDTTGEMDAVPVDQFPNDQNKHTLQNFIFSEANTLVQKIAVKIAEATPNTFNPIFMFGSPGCGQKSSLKRYKKTIWTRTPLLLNHAI